MRFKLRSLLSFAALATLAVAACNKDDEGTTTPDPTQPRRWTKVYRDVILGDDSNSVEGQYLDTRTGIVHKMQTLPDSLRDNVSLMYYVTQTGSYNFLTSTGSLGDIPTGTVYSLVVSAAGYGLSNWSAAQKNTFEGKQASSGGVSLSPQEFESVISTGTWDAFNNAFKENNSGDEYLAFTSSSIGPDGGQVYFGEINNAVRCIIYVKSVSSNPATGFVKFDIIVEGRTDAPSGAAAIMPAE